MKRAYALIIVPVTAFGLAACGSSHDSKSASTSMPGMAMSSAPASASAAGHNGADVMFAQMMIPHHQQAVEMAKLAATHASMPEVKKLAATIEGAQQPEITKMTGWLTDWKAAMPSGGGMSMGNDGMMSDADMKKLAKLKGMAFDKMFLQMMIKHHQGAITMAKTEQAQGQAGDAKTMATSIVTSQSAEIAAMNKYLNAM